jgi:hypothetical protein
MDFGSNRCVKFRTGKARLRERFLQRASFTRRGVDDISIVGARGKTGAVDRPEPSRANFRDGLSASLPAYAQAADSAWPAHLIKAVIPFGAGSATDMVPRPVFDRLAAELGQPIVIENRAGPGARSAPRPSRRRIPMATPSSPVHRR